MMFGNDRRNIRAQYLAVWNKVHARLPLEPLEAIIADVLALHPEYHPLFEGGEDALDRDWTPEGGQSNPFLHMGLHIALREQVASDRPGGIRALHGAACRSNVHAHEAEHRMIECLARTLWEAGRSGLPPDEAAYLDCLRRTVGANT